MEVVLWKEGEAGRAGLREHAGRREVWPIIRRDEVEIWRDYVGEGGGGEGGGKWKRLREVVGRRGRMMCEVRRKITYMEMNRDKG